MRDTDFLYASGVIKCLENTLTEPSFFESIISARDFDAAKKLLIEKGFVGFEKTDVCETALSGYMAGIYEELSEILGDKKSVLDFLIVKNDFHNLKAAIKLNVSKMYGSEYFRTPSLILPDVVFGAVKEKNFGALPDFLSECAAKAWEILVSTSDGQLLECFIDSNSLDAAYACAEKSESGFAKEKVLFENTLINFKTAMRLSKNRNSSALSEYAFAEKTLFPAENLREAAAEGTEKVLEAIDTFGNDALSEAAHESISALEKVSDDLLTDFIGEKNFMIPFGAETAMNYYLSRENEYKNLCTAVSFKKAGFLPEDIRKRMRKCHE